MLEEIGYEYKVTKVNIEKGDQFKTEFKKISPLSKIPVIIDHENNKTVFESGAILIYLAEKSGMFYDEKERLEAIKKIGKNAEITRFKGLGEISPSEFKHFIGENIRLEPVIIGKEAGINEILSFYMGKNTPERQQFIIENLKVEKDLN